MKHIHRNSLGLAATLAAGFISASTMAASYEGIHAAPLNTVNSNLPSVIGTPAQSAALANGVDRHKGEQLLVRLSDERVTADGKSPVMIEVEAQDSNGRPLSREVLVTVQVSRGRILTASSNSTLRMNGAVVDQETRALGTQVLTRNGKVVVTVQAPAEAGVANVLVSSGNLTMQSRLDFVVEARPMLAVGIIDGILSATKVQADTNAPLRTNDGLEDELQEIGVTRRGLSVVESEGRAAAFAKGEVGDGYQLTMAFDTDKDRTRFFRDIQPDQFYPIYGDASIRGFDAQTTRSGYLRLERNQSYFMFGDYNTEAQGSRARSLGAYQRTLTGGVVHLEGAGGVMNAFASQDSLRRVIDEQPGRGISGPYSLSSGAGVLNSEQVDIVTRDRSQPAVILDVQRLTRFADYEFEPFSGQLLFRRPIPTVDANLNPVSVRVSYEVEGGGPKFWVSGANVQFKAGNRVELGASVAEDGDPLARYSLYSGNATVKLGQNGTVLFESAASFNGASPVQQSDKGQAFRTEYRYAGARASARLFWGRADAGFDNPSSVLNAGRREIGGKAMLTINDSTSLTLDATRTEDTIIGADRTGATATIGRNFRADKARLEIGMRYGRDEVNPTGAVARPRYSSVYSYTPLGTLSTGSYSNGAFVNGQTKPNEFTTIHSRFTAAVTPRMNAYVEADVAISERGRPGDNEAWAFAVGADYLVAEKTSVYARHEQAQSLGGLYGLGTGEEHNATLVGVSTSLREDTQVFSEYRLNDAISGRDAQAAVGLRNLWRVREGLGISTNLEKLTSFDDTSRSAMAMGLGFEYTGSARSKASGRLERRSDGAAITYLSTLAYTAKLNQDWSLLLRNLYSDSDSASLAAGTQIQDRAIIGLAYRDTGSNVLSSLMRYEFKTESDTNVVAPIDREVNIFSYHTNYKPTARLTVAGEVAGKWVSERIGDQLGATRSNFAANLFAGRVTYDLNDRWDFGVAGSVLRSDQSAKQYAVGLELGRILMRNLWGSVGFNFTGFSDPDFDAADYSRRGAYFRLRYKFDEKTLGYQAATRPAQAQAAPVAAAPAPVAAPPPPPAPVDSDRDGVVDGADRCPNTPAGARVDANGCELDGDRDGVVDRLDRCPQTPAGDKVDEVGCGLSLTLQVNFDNNSSNIKSESFSELNAFSEFLKAVPSARGDLEGHTDSVGSEAYNQKLSQSRAESVKQYVVEKGVATDRLNAVGYGESQPVADNATPEGRASNRRVMFTRKEAKQ